MARLSGKAWLCFVFMVPAPAALSATTLIQVGELCTQRVADNIVGGVAVLSATALATPARRARPSRCPDGVRGPVTWISPWRSGPPLSRHLALEVGEHVEDEVELRLRASLIDTSCPGVGDAFGNAERSRRQVEQDRTRHRSGSAARWPRTPDPARWSWSTSGRA
jgi:hypothetical protein